jgi:hypothetical protein
MAPASISSLPVFTTTNGAVGKDVAAAGTIGELLACVPALYLPRTKQFINSVYRAALKANHVRSYLSTCKKHKADGTFPPEIPARLQGPVLHISKEYEATAACKKSRLAQDIELHACHIASLNNIITIKTGELQFLQGLMAESYFKNEMDLIWIEVTRTICEHAGVDPPQVDGSVADAKVPAFLIQDYLKMKACRMLYPARALAIAFKSIQQREVNSKMKALALKKDADGDVQVMDATDKSATVEALVDKTLKRLLSEGKISLQGPGTSPTSERGVAQLG